MSGVPTSAPATSNSDERRAFAKLEALKDIRSKTVALEKLRLRLLHEIDAVEGEDRCLSEFRREMELLQQEKMAHVEELRQIHADINAMETVMKQAEEAKRQAHESARRALEEYAPLKHDVDIMRTELLGLEKLPDLPNEDKERMGSVGLLDKPKGSIQFDLQGFSNPWNHHERSAEQQAAAEKAAAGFFGLGGSSGNVPRSSSSSQVGAAAAAAAAAAQGNPFLAAAAAQHSAAMGLGHLGHLGPKADQLRTSLAAQSVGSVSGPPPFRQQPPPMKSCLSCHQQIHRNAPICPLCKAKSRSRNPKKPKRKD